LLGIHRNTLTGRLRHIEKLLGHELAGIDTQAELALALRLGPARIVDRRTGAGGCLDALLATPEVSRWADLWLAPLLESAHAALLDTVRVWLKHDTRVEPTAAALGLSVPGVRKRLGRVERLLQRSVLTGPSAAGELHLALRGLDLRRKAAR
jgi:DNA-binding PucR family transcriptional regulator